MAGASRGRYSLGALRGHTEHIRIKSRRKLRGTSPELDEAFAVLARFIGELEGLPRCLAPNVHLLLSCRFMNQVYAALLLAESGLFAEAAICERAAIETLSAAKLLQVNPSIEQQYESGRFLKPVEVRKELERLGYPEEVECLRGLYGVTSDVMHVSRAAERWSTKWLSADEGTLLLGGKYSHTDLESFTGVLVTLTRWFASDLESNAKQ